MRRLPVVALTLLLGVAACDEETSTTTEPQLSLIHI